jgi:hypothetical protein
MQPYIVLLISFVTNNIRDYVQCLGALIPGIRQPGREGDYSPLSSAAKNAWSYNSTPQYIFMVWCLIKQEMPSSLCGV